MRIDKPLCSFSNCEFCFDGNCMNKLEYERCEYNLLLKKFNYIIEKDKEKTMTKEILNQANFLLGQIGVEKIQLDCLKEENAQFEIVSSKSGRLDIYLEGEILELIIKKQEEYLEKLEKEFAEL